MEEWRDVVGAEGFYQVSNLGNIKRIKKSARACSGRFLSPGRNERGYRQVVLGIDGVHKARKVHRLVAEAFLGIKPIGMKTNHIDGNKENNSANNLEYITHRENCIHSANHQLHPVGERCHFHKLTSDDVFKIKDLHASGLFTGYRIAKLFSVSFGCIYSIINNKSWRHIKEVRLSSSTSPNEN